MLYLTFYFVFSFAKFDLVVVDQITLPIPILRLFRYKVLYYCHFPEALLNDNKLTKLVKVYRFFMDIIEQVCLYFATVICFNSNYTRNTVESTFPFVRKWKGKKYTVYPCVQNPPSTKKAPEIPDLEPSNYLLTVNRFETRKRLDLCISAFADAIQKNERIRDSRMKLVLAGGLDRKNQDALRCRQSLSDQARDLGIRERVVFRENISQEEKEWLLR